MNRYITVRDVKSFGGELDNFLKIQNARKHFMLRYTNKKSSLSLFYFHVLYLHIKVKHAALLLLKLDACI